MLDLIITEVIDKDKIEEMEDMTEIKGIVLYCEPGFFTYEDTTAYTPKSIDIAFDRKFCSKEGYHYSMDEERIDSCTPPNKITKHLRGEKLTFISKAMYENKVNEHSLSVLLLAPKDHKYENIEKRAIKFLAKLCIDHELSPDTIMRGFDLDRSPSPTHLLDKNKWRKFIKRVEDTFLAMKEETYKDLDLEKLSPIYRDVTLKKFYLENGEIAEDYASDFEPDHRDIEAIVKYQATDSELTSFVTGNKTTFTYTVLENVPNSSSHCSRAFDTLTAKVEPNTLEVEPIYPDIVLPPGGTTTFVSSMSPTSVNQSNDVPLSVEEFEKRQKVFNIKDYMDAEKKIEGKPVNNNDPFPVDDKVKELESHSPKVKIDQVNFILHDCNHPGSVIGESVSKNFAMIQDQIVTMAKRTERRLVRLENNMATIMRYLFRMSARVNVNCVYYGGQDVFGKYKCIRCLHDDRINDGQSMTMDQCLSCTRYEPVLGQVYAILDDTGTNITQILDDMQMAYMDKDDYMMLTRTEELIKSKEFADPSNHGAEPKQFKDIFEEGFKMDWNNTHLETQRANVAEYKTEGIEANKPEIKSENQGIEKPEFEDVVEEDQEYETLKYNSEDYTFKNFGESFSSNISSDGSFGQGAAEIRNKIIAYAENGFKLGQEGKGRYTMNTIPSAGPMRSSHDENAINGVHYWDCSSFVEAAYKSAGITTVTGTTFTEYPVCFPTAGGMLFNADEEDKALPGDLVFFSDPNTNPKTVEELMAVTIGSIYHVGIYVGNGEYIHASTDEAPPTDQIRKSKTQGSGLFVYARAKDLVEADKKASALTAGGEGFFNYDEHKFNDTITGLASKYCEGQVQSVIDNMAQYGYKQAVIEISKKHGLDPYFVLGLIATESSGDPTDRSGGYWGIMQTSSSITRATGNLEDIKYDIELGCAHYHKLRNYLKKPRGENQVLATYAYNAGNGTVDVACDRYGEGAENAKGGEIAQYVADVAVEYWGPSKQDECTSYVAKIILRANSLRAKKALE